MVVAKVKKLSALTLARNVIKDAGENGSFFKNILKAPDEISRSVFDNFSLGTEVIGVVLECDQRGVFAYTLYINKGEARHIALRKEVLELQIAPEKKLLVEDKVQGGCHCGLKPESDPRSLGRFNHMWREAISD